MATQEPSIRTSVDPKVTELIGPALLMPVLQPRLPSAAAIIPYLHLIDSQRWYANYGPLVTQLEQRLSARYAQATVITTASGTSGLTAALLAHNIPFGSDCLMPSWTFAATPHAARAAGLTPWFHDVDPQTWALDPGTVAETLLEGSCRAKAVVVVSPFGAPVDVAAWQAFEDRTGCPVVLDAAAGFDSVEASRVATVVSLHATKIFGAGEGGFLLTTDTQLLRRARACCNFGFAGSRSAISAAVNAKMSEYHAAVALANFDNWPAIRARHARITNWYRSGLKRFNAAILQPGYGDAWVSSTTNIVLSRHSAQDMSDVLRGLGIETRTWWGRGCHAQPAFADCPRGDLRATEALGERVLGLPHFPEMQKHQVDAVIEALTKAVIILDPPRRRTA